jgi:hypothetical protein
MQFKVILKYNLKKKNISYTVKFSNTKISEKNNK